MSDDADLIDASALRDEFSEANRIASLRAQWAANDPAIPPDACRYCGRYWQRRAGGRIDGHAACIVGEEFKLRVGELLRSPTVTYAKVAAAIGLTPGVVRSWAFTAGVAGPVSHPLRSLRQ